MNKKPKILAFSGSSRKESFNTKLLKIAAQGVTEAGGELTTINLAELAMPLFCQDLEAEKGMTPGGQRLKDLMKAHDGFLIAAPEYNSSISGLLKNAIDWASRPQKDDAYPLVAFKGKAVILMSASPGALGGLRGLVHVRSILGNLGMIVLPDQLCIPNAHEAFNEQGDLLNAPKQEAAKALGRKLTEFLGLIT